MILDQGARVGFALVTPDGRKRSSPAVGVLRRIRRAAPRVGRGAALLLFHRYGGEWEIVEDEQNRAALAFWRSVIATLTDGRYRETRSAGEVRHLFQVPVRPHTPALNAARLAGRRASRPVRLQHATQIPAGVRLRAYVPPLRASRPRPAAAARAAFRTEIDHPVGGLDHVEIVLDHDDRVALVARRSSTASSRSTSREVQTGRRLVEQVQRAAGGTLRELARELYALRLAARQCRRGLPEPQIRKPDVVQGVELGSAAPGYCGRT